jgi:hypothetical protein
MLETQFRLPMPTGCAWVYTLINGETEGVSSPGEPGDVQRQSLGAHAGQRIEVRVVAATATGRPLAATEVGWLEISE